MAFDRFYKKLKENDKGCLEWQGYCQSSGHGQIFFNGKLIGTHRLAWLLSNGEIPNGMQVLHKCDNGSCCNPNHLFLGTHADNMKDMCHKGRGNNQKKTHCKNGHEFSFTNTMRNGNGRKCKQCHRIRSLNYHYKKMTEVK
jgi:hypothetical protein